jgi:hypothetical protein
VSRRSNATGGGIRHRIDAFEMASATEADGEELRDVVESVTFEH